MTSSSHTAGRVIMVRAAVGSVIHISVSDRSYLDVALPHRFVSTLCGREITAEWSEVGGLITFGPSGIDVSAIAPLDRWRAPGTELRRCSRCHAAWLRRIDAAHGDAIASVITGHAPDGQGIGGLCTLCGCSSKIHAAAEPVRRACGRHESFPTPIGRELAELSTATDAELTAIATAAVETAEPVRRAPSSVGNPVDVDAVTSALLASPDGATVDGRGAPYRGDGYVVALPEHGVTLVYGHGSAVIREAIAEWVRTVAPVVSLYAARWFGAWTDETGRLVLDVVESFSATERSDAMAIARGRGQAAVWHAGTRECIDPTRAELSGSAVPWAVRATRALNNGDASHLHASFPVIDQSAIRGLAIAYGHLSPEVSPGSYLTSVWRAMRDETLRQLDELQARGLTVVVQDVDPYHGDPVAMFADIARGTIRILSTRATGGHPLWSDADNDAFRAVHDVLGHAATGRGFDRHGEEAAYLAHRELYSPLARLALATETRGQNAAMLHAGGEFDVQRIGILPAHLRAPELHNGASAADRRDAIARHLSSGLTLQ